MIICHCTVVNDGRVRELVGSGATDLLDVASATGAGSFCGGCQPSIASVISRLTGEPTSALLDRRPSPLGDVEASALPTPVSAVVQGVEQDAWRRRDAVPFASPSDRELAARFRTSPGTVREARVVLRAHGTLRPGDGAEAVHPPDARAVTRLVAVHLSTVGVVAAEVADVRSVLERLAVRCACAHPDPDRAADLGTQVRDGPDATRVRTSVAAVTGNPVLVLLLDVVRSLAGDGLESSGAPMAVAEAVVEGDEATALAHLDAHLGCVDPTARAAVVRFEAADDDPVGLLARVVDLAAHRALAPGDELGTEKAVAAELDVDARALRRAVPVMELHAVATRQPGPRATLAVATPDPWPSIELLASLLEWSGAEPGQLLHVRHALESRAVELASVGIDDEAAARLRRRLDEESTAIGRGGAGDRVFHTIHPLLAELSGNRVLAHVAIAANLALLRMANRDPELARFLGSGVGDRAGTHAAIVDAATRGDVATGRRLVDEHGARHATHR